MRRATFRRPQIERKPVVYTPAERMGVYAPAGGGEAVPKPEALKPGKRTPTVAEKRWMDAITAIGCIACRIDGRPGVPGAVHHLLRGGFRIGHLHTICLCDPGHHKDGGPMGLVSRHPWKARFEARYGTEEELLELSRRLVGEEVYGVA